jgi:hypothetical protein
MGPWGVLGSPAGDAGAGSRGRFLPHGGADDYLLSLGLQVRYGRPVSPKDGG